MLGRRFSGVERVGVGGEAELGKREGVFEEHRDGHGPHPTGHGRDFGGARGGGGEFHVTDEAVPGLFRGVRHGVGADVDADGQTAVRMNALRQRAARV